MDWTYWFALSALVICNIACIFHFFRLVGLGPPTDYSYRRGSVQKAVKYAFTRAMNPAKKESAFLHLPTYTAGILYHLGTFMGFFLFILALLRINPGKNTSLVLAAFLLISAISGAAILLKRILKKELIALSNPDDFISNILVTLFQLITALMLLDPSFLSAYFVITGILLLYMPVGKLKHTVYFFSARYHLGFFYGWRGVWPPK
ncbi:MAG: hypothetical protein KQI35_12865 [Bacteroidetes bacterium]|nr:hypothetical protein [Bacteroidota bacterium]